MTKLERWLKTIWLNSKHSFAWIKKKIFRDDELVHCRPLVEHRRVLWSLSEFVELETACVLWQAAERPKRRNLTAVSILTMSDLLTEVAWS
jgi:hypothetical protein